MKDRNCFPPCPPPDMPNMCPPNKRPVPCVPPVPSVVEGESLYEAVNNLSNRVNVCINTYNDVMANCYKTLENLERAAEENGAYYGPCEVWTETGYCAEESATYTLIHKACVDRRGQPIRMEMHLAYGNTTNSKIEQGLFSASKITFADKIVTALPLGPNGWYGNAIWHGAPIATSEAPELYTMGFTRSGVMRVYSNGVKPDQMLRDTIENAMGVPGVLIMNGQLTEDSWRVNIPERDQQVERVVMGQNLDTREVIILVCGNENNVNHNGMTSAACAKILLQYGCDIAVELTEGASAGAMDKGSLMFNPQDNNVPNAYVFWYISRKCFYKTDYERELAELMQNYGKCIWETYLNYNRIVDLRRDLTKEIADRENGDEVLQGQILTEVEARVKADEVLQRQILEEVTNRVNADDVLQNQILAEVDNRQKADEVLQNQILEEVAAREAADTQLSDRILTEMDARIAADNVLQQDINNEIESRKDADANLQAQILAETQNRVDADAVLQNAINVEQGARIAADEVLQTNINNEAATRAQEDQKLSDAINAEETARIEADNALKVELQTNIDALASRVTQAESNITTLQELYNTLQQQTAAMDTAITAIQQTITSIETSLNNIKATIEQIRTGELVLPYVRLSGDTMSGNLNMGGHLISDVADPASNQDVATKKYVDDARYSLPVATADVLGGIKVGENLTVTDDGTLSANSGAYTLPAATTTTLGGVIIGQNLSVTPEGVLSAAGGGGDPYVLPAATTTTLGGVKVGDRLTVSQDGTISANEQTYSLPTASASTLGGVKVGQNLSVTEDGTLNASGGSSYVLPIATPSVLGGVKTGENLHTDTNGVMTIDDVFVKKTGDTMSGELIVDLTPEGGSLNTLTLGYGVDYKIDFGEQGYSQVQLNTQTSSYTPGIIVERSNVVNSNDTNTYINITSDSSGGTIAARKALNGTPVDSQLTISTDYILLKSNNQPLTSISNLADPTSPQDAATKNYVDSYRPTGDYLPLSWDGPNAQTLTNGTGTMNINPGMSLIMNSNTNNQKLEFHAAGPSGIEIKSNETLNINSPEVNVPLGYLVVEDVIGASAGAHKAKLFITNESIEYLETDSVTPSITKNWRIGKTLNNTIEFDANYNGKVFPISLRADKIILRGELSNNVYAPIKITNLDSPTDNTDAANKAYVDSVAGRMLIVPRARSRINPTTTDSRISVSTTNDLEIYAVGGIISANNIGTISLPANSGADYYGFTYLIPANNTLARALNQVENSYNITQFSASSVGTLSSRSAIWPINLALTLVKNADNTWSLNVGINYYWWNSPAVSEGTFLWDAKFFPNIINP